MNGKHLLPILLLFCLSGCLPKSAIVQQYQAADAATIMIYRDYKDIGDQYFMVDFDIVSLLPPLDKAEVKVSPGTHTVAAKSMAVNMNSIPLRLKFEPGSFYYYKAIQSVAAGGIMIEEISQKEFAALMARGEVKSNFRGLY